MRQFTIKENLASTQEAEQPKKREFIPSTSKSKLNSGYQVAKIDKDTQEVNTLTEPGHLRATKNSKRGLESIGIEDLFLIHSEWFKKARKKKVTFTP